MDQAPGESAAGTTGLGVGTSPIADTARMLALEEAVRARDDFLAIAAHELRSPMQSLALRLAVLERHAQDRGDPPLLEEIRRVRRGAERYVRRAAVLLDVARLNAGELRPARTAVDIRSLVEDVVEAYTEEARFQGAELRVAPLPDGVARWDPHMAEEILSNLVGNAIKYGGGSPVSVAVRVDGQDAVFEVSDGGPGIGEEDRARIFAKFERIVDGTRHSGGFGLGLWIVGSMVAAHGGRIEVESAPGHGTLFRVRLPMA